MRSAEPPNWINVGTGTDVTICKLTETVAAVAGHTSAIRWDVSKPDDTPRKLMDVSQLRERGWRAWILLADGLARSHVSFL